MIAPEGRIIAATDFSEHAQNAVARAARLARAHGATIELLHVLSRPSLDAVREWLEQGTAERLVADVRVQLARIAAAADPSATHRLVIGDAFADIVASCPRAALLAIGARGVNPLRDAILGTTAERLVGRYEGSVLVVKNPPLDAYRKVVVGLDLLPGSRSLLETAMRFAPDAALAAAHAYDVPFDGALQRAGVPEDTIARFRNETQVRATSAILAMGLAVAGDAQRVRPVTDRTHPARLIVDSARSLEADLVVVGKRRHSTLESLLVGSVARHVLADTTADVLVVPLAD
jgi:nucleotide-binding universal stress UspA family protein